MSVLTPSDFVSGGKANELRLPDVLFALAASERPSAEVDTVYETQVSSGFTGAETRRALRDRPFRRLRLRAEAFDAVDSGWLRSLVYSQLNQRFVWPIFADQSKVQGDVLSGATSITCETDYRRFFVSGRVAVWQRPMHRGAAPTFAAATVSAIGSGGLTFTAPLAVAISAPALVAPLAECEVLTDGPLGFDFHDQATADLSLLEVGGAQALPGRAAIGSVPSGATIYDGLPVMDVTCRRVRLGTNGWTRPGSVSRLGLSTWPDIRGSAPAATLDIGVEFTSRPAAWDWLTFCESRGGRAHPFWLLMPDFELDAVAMTATTISLRAAAPVAEYVGQTVGVRLADGTIHGRVVASASRDAGVDTLTLASALPAAYSPDDVFIGYMRKVRLDTDVVAESWPSLGRMDASLSVIEVLEEKAVIGKIALAGTLAIGVAFIAIQCGQEAVDPSLDPPDVWKITACDGGATIYIAHSVQDFSAYENQSVDLEAGDYGGCHHITRALTGTAATYTGTLTVLGDPFAGCGACLAVNPGDGPPDTGDSPAPCECPSGLASSYRVQADIYSGGVFQYSVDETASGTGCSWSGPASLLSLDTIGAPNCHWSVDPDSGLTMPSIKATGNTPVGSYPNSSNELGDEARNIVVSP